jgi:hypothetical protein
MKKLLTMLAMLMIGMSTTLVQAQTKKTAQVVTTTKAHTKKDGTADKRYKENKVSSSTTVVGPTKKDGTADMRFKANKTTTVKKVTPKS